MSTIAGKGNLLFEPGGRMPDKTHLTINRSRKRHWLSRYRLIKVVARQNENDRDL